MERKKSLYYDKYGAVWILSMKECIRKLGVLQIPHAIQTSASQIV